MNKFIAIGRLTKDAEVRRNNDTCVARFTLAVDRVAKEKATDFIPCVAFGKTAELLEKYGRKGLKLGIEGRIQTGNYTNKDGQKVYTTDSVVERLEFCESKSNSTQASSSDDSWQNIPEGIDEELPFR